MQHLCEKIQQQQQEIEKLKKRKREEDEDFSQPEKKLSDTFQNNLRKLEEKTLSPSSATWDLLVENDLVADFEAFALQVQENTMKISNELDQFECLDAEAFDHVQEKIRSRV